MFRHLPCSISHLFASVAMLTLAFVAPAQYCTPTADCSIGDGLRLVTLSNLSNSSDCEADLGVAGYGDFTALGPIELSQSVTYDATLLSGYQGQQVSMWIDANDDMLFDATELVLIDAEVGTETVVHSVTIPADLPLGIHRLRVMATWNGPSSASACEQGIYGETEDYTINVGPPPSCINVYGINASAIASNEATIEWVEAGDAMQWDIEIGDAGFTPTGMPTVGYDNVDMPATVAGLLPVSSYDVYVRADCGGDNVSDASTWSGPFTFETACGAVVPDYYTDFVDGLPSCWTAYGEGLLEEGPMAEGTSNWFGSTFANQGPPFGGAMGNSVFSPATAQWLVSPDFLLTGDAQQMEIDLSITQSFGTDSAQLGEDDAVHMLISTDAGSQWSILQTWDSVNVIAPSGEHLSYDLSAFNGATARFAVYVSSGETGNFNGYQVTLDNFRIQALGAPIQLTVDAITEPNCFGSGLGSALLTLSGGVSPYTYLWNDGTTTLDLIDAEPGTYTLEVLDASGQTGGIDEVVVEGVPTLIIQATVTNESVVGANDGAISIDSISGGSGQYGFTWNNGDDTQTIDGLIDAFWCVFITDFNNGCETDSCFEVLEGMPVGLLELDEEVMLNIAPNPALNGITYMSANLADPGLWSIEVRDALGRVVWNYQTTGSTINQLAIDLQAQSKGIYVLHLFRHADGASTYRKLYR